jgi:hypothetical protein
MSTTLIIRTIVTAVALFIGSHAAAGSITLPTRNAVPSVMLAKADKDKAKAKPAPKKKAPKDKTPAKLNKKTGAAKDKPKAKAKATAKGKEPAKTLKAKAGTAGSGKKKAAAAVAAEDEFYDDDTSSSSADAGFWFMLALGILAVCGIGFMLWLEYRPTVYPSGKTYGPFDFLPAAKGGAFTSEYGADAMAQWNGNQQPAAQTKQPATVTREPLHTRKTEQVPRTRESA